MPRRRSELPQTLEECHELILALFDKIDELLATVARLERELYGPRRERFINDHRHEEDATTEDGEGPPASGSWLDEITHVETTELESLVDDAGDEETSIPPLPVPFDPSLPAPPATEPSPKESPATEPLPTEPPAAETNSTDNQATPRKRPTVGRRPRVFPENATRVKVYHPLDESKLSAELLHHPQARRFYRFVRQEVELPQRHIRILEHYQEVIAVDDADQVTTVMHAAPMPAPLLDRCYAGNSLLAYIAVSRFADHLPYYREEDILRREGLSIHRSTLWRWMRGLARVLTPLVELIRQRLRRSEVLGIDETPCPMLDPSLPHTRKVYLYTQYGDESQPYTGYYFAEYKTRANIEVMLESFRGVLQSDAYICYELITAASLDDIQPAACWAHGRRKFEPLVVPDVHNTASRILAEIQLLYDIEDRGREMTVAERRELRQAESRPIVERLHQQLVEIQATERPRDENRKAANYFLKRWESFTHYLTNGAIRIDNNATEASFKGIATGKKAWLFLGNQSAGETAAIFYTLIMSCKRHCIEPQSYLLDVMQRIKSASADELESLLPDRWIKSHPEAYLEQRAQESNAAAVRKRVRRQQRRRPAAKA